MRRKDMGRPIKRARARANLTQRELAFLVGCSQTAIYRLELPRPAPAGLETISEELAIKIVRRLPADLEDLFVDEQAVVALVPTSVTPITGRVPA